MCLESDGDAVIPVKISSAALSKMGKNMYATLNWIEVCRSQTHVQVRGLSHKESNVQNPTTGLRFGIEVF